MRYDMGQDYYEGLSLKVKNPSFYKETPKPSWKEDNIFFGFVLCITVGFLSALFIVWATGGI